MPVWFVCSLILMVLISAAALYLIDKKMKKDMEDFIEALDMSNRLSKVKAFEKCKKEL